MILFLFRVLSLLPLRVLHAIGASLGWVLYACTPAYRRRIDENLPANLPDRAHALREAIGESGKQVMELAWVWTCTPQRILARTQTENPEVLEAALQQDRAILMLTPHLGCFEAIGRSYMASNQGRARPMLALYREPRKSFLRPLFTQARASGGLLLAPADLHGVRLMIKSLREHGVVGLLPDQVPSRGEGVWAPFFGRPAYTMTLPARLARAHDALVLLVFARRLPAGQGYRIYWQQLDDGLDGDPLADATRLNRAMERLVLRCPEQYLWSYNRYKVPPGVSAPGTPAPDIGSAPQDATR
jgi:KDO2-lipid IV(A) lauroyltransferase